MLRFFNFWHAVCKLSFFVVAGSTTEPKPQERSIMFYRLRWTLVILTVFVAGCVSVGRTDGIYSPGYHIGGLPMTGH